MPTGQSMAFEQHARRTEPVLLRQGQGMQQMIGIGGDVTLRQPLQEYQRPLGAAVQQRRRRRQAQDDRIAGSGANGLFGQWQKSIACDAGRQRHHTGSSPSRRLRSADRAREAGDRREGQASTARVFLVTEQQATRLWPRVEGAPSTWHLQIDDTCDGLSDAPRQA